MRTLLRNRAPLLAVGISTGIGIGIGGTLLIQQWTKPGEAPDHTPERKQAAGLLLEGEPALGKATAPLTIMEFSDFECSYCRRFHEKVFPKLKSQYIDTGLVRFIHKDLPLPFHPHALQAAAAARCAGEQNRYWDMYAALFNQQNCLGCKGVLTIAAEKQLDTTALQTCMERKATVAVINTNRSEASLHKISATPTFVIGPTRSDGSLDGRVIEGALPWRTFKPIIDKALRGLEQS